MGHASFVSVYGTCVVRTCIWDMSRSYMYMGYESFEYVYGRCVVRICIWDMSRSNMYMGHESFEYVYVRLDRLGIRHEVCVYVYTYI